MSHGLWGGAVFGEKETGTWKWAFFWGMAPDLFSFGPFFLTHLPMIIHRWASRIRMEPPDSRIIPAYVYHAYNVTHSLVIFAIAFTLTWLIVKKIPWVLGAWGLHILCDVPTHSTRFFPTPYLWPFPTPFVNGHRWSTPTFMLANYSCIAVTYLAIYTYKSIKKRAHA